MAGSTSHDQRCSPSGRPRNRLFPTASHSLPQQSNPLQSIFGFHGPQRLPPPAARRGRAPRAARASASATPPRCRRGRAAPADMRATRSGMPALACSSVSISRVHRVDPRRPAPRPPSTGPQSRYPPRPCWQRSAPHSPGPPSSEAREETLHDGSRPAAGPLQRFPAAAERRPITLTRSTLSQIASVLRASVPFGPVMPALLTTHPARRSALAGGEGRPATAAGSSHIRLHRQHLRAGRLRRRPLPRPAACRRSVKAAIPAARRRQPHHRRADAPPAAGHQPFSTLSPWPLPFRAFAGSAWAPVTTGRKPRSARPCPAAGVGRRLRRRFDQARAWRR